MDSDVTSEITLRSQIKPGDLGRIVELHGHLYSSEYGFDEGFEGYVAKTLGEFISDYYPERGRLWMAESNGQLLGCVGVVLRETGEAQLRWLLLHPNARGQGLGRRLVQATIDYADEMSCHSIYLWTVSPLHDAARLYRACGFELVEESESQRLWGSDLSEQRYERRLSEQ